MFRRIAAIVVLGLIAYCSMLQSPFKTMDDRVSIVDNQAIKSFQNIPVIFTEGYFHDQSYYRPLVNLSFMTEYHFFGLNPFFFNLDNLILHILNALLVFLLVSRLTNNDTIGFWTGLLFVIHPVQWEAVCNIAGRSILLSAFFGLSSLILFLAYYKTRRWFYVPCLLITFSLGLLCKESSAVLPVVLLAYFFLDTSTPWLRKLKCFWPFIAVLIGYFFLRHSIGLTNIYHAQVWLQLALGFLTFLRSVMTDLRLFLLPLDMHFDRCLPFFMSVANPSAIMAIVFWSVVWGAIYIWRKYVSAFVFFLICWFAIELLPVSQIVSGIGVGTGYISTAEHFLYLAAIPVLIGMVLAFRWLYEQNERFKFFSPTLLKCLVGGFLVFIGVITVEQSIYASNEYTMIERSLSFQPNNPRLQGAMGYLSVVRNDLPDAVTHFQAAIKAEPGNASYHISLGSALCQQGRWIEALAQYLAFDPGKDKELAQRQEKICMMHIRREMAQGKSYGAREWLAIGIYDGQNGHVDQAIKDFSNAVRLNPDLPNAWMNLASLYDAKGDLWSVKRAYHNLLACHDIGFDQKEFVVKRLAALEGH